MPNPLELLRIYCAAVESLSFKEAATRLGTSPQAVTRAIQQLEHHYGEVLFVRSTRQVRATERGEALAARARELIRDADELLGTGAAASQSSLAGEVRVTAPKAIGELFLLPALTRLMQEHRELRVDLRLSDAISDVIEERIDVGVRVGIMRDNRFVMREVSRVDFVVVATPALIRKTGAPTDTRALATLPTTALFDRNTGRKWPWQFAHAQPFVPATPAFATDDPAAECAAVRTGLGFGQLAGYLAGPYVQSGKLVTILDDERPAPWPVCVYRPQRGPVPKRVRLVFDTIAAALSALPKVPRLANPGGRRRASQSAPRSAPQ